MRTDRLYELIESTEDDMEAQSAGALKGHRLKNVGEVIILDPMVASSLKAAKPVAPAPASQAVQPSTVATQPSVISETVPDKPFVPARPAPVPAAVAIPAIPESTSDSHFTREAENFRARQAANQPKEGDPTMSGGGGDHGHGGGGGGAVSPDVIKWIVIAIAAVIGVVLFMRFVDWATNRNTAPQYFGQQPFTPSPPAFAPTAQWGNMQRPPGFGGVPSPEDVARMAPHSRQFIPVPCAEGYVLNPQDGRCYRVRWVPGN